MIKIGEYGKLYCGECIEVMKSLSDNSIDMILADLPYGITQNKWDKTIDIKALWSQFNRLCNKNIVLFGKGRFSAELILSNDNYRYTLIWEKTKASGFFNSKEQIMPIHEDILIFYKKLATYNPQMTKGLPQMNGSKGGSSSNYGKGERILKFNETGNRYPKSIIKFNNIFTTIHPTQKPIDLLEYLIRTFSNKNETILDPCSGSGSTCIAAENTGRKWIGIELEDEYYTASKKRIIDHINNMTPDLIDL